MIIKALGCGNDFSTIRVGNSNFMITSDSGKRFMVDWGTTAPYIYRDELFLDFADIDAMFISHIHGGHSSLELLAFHRYFLPKKDENGKRINIKLYGTEQVLINLWETLEHSLQSLEDREATLNDYFDVNIVEEIRVFSWEELRIVPIKTKHVKNNGVWQPSNGLVIRNINNNKECYISGDSIYDETVFSYYRTADLILQECETGKHRSGVHTSYDDLRNLPLEIKRKMWLYHYCNIDERWHDDGFAGFVEKGQEFTI